MGELMELCMTNTESNIPENASPQVKQIFENVREQITDVSPEVIKEANSFTALIRGILDSDIMIAFKADKLTEAMIKMRSVHNAVQDMPNVSNDNLPKVPNISNDNIPKQDTKKAA